MPIIHVLEATIYFVKINQKDHKQRMRVVNSSHATRDVGSDVYLKRLYHPPETLFLILLSIDFTLSKDCLPSAT